jgi:hypothetical protein
MRKQRDAWAKAAQDAVHKKRLDAALAKQAIR